MSALPILLYNKVQLDDGSQGIVRYMGNIMGKKGIFYGIDMTKGDAKNDGTFKNIKYFDTKKGTRTGRFCKENKIIKCKKTTFSKYPFKLGDTVMCTKVKCKGTVKYVGVPSWAKGGKVYYGLELQKKKGTSNGTNQGVQYFEAKMNYGIYVASKHVKKATNNKTIETKNKPTAKYNESYENLLMTAFIHYIEMKHAITFPNQLKDLVFKFYFIPNDYFDSNLCINTWKKEMEIYDNNKCITNKNVEFTWDCGDDTTCYGSKVIPSIIKNKTYIWKFKNIHTTTNGLFIGIDNSDAKWIYDGFHNKKEKACYAYHGCLGEIFGWNQKDTSGHPIFENKGDILIMKLEFKSKNGILTFKVNNKAEFIATKDVTQHKSLKYRMAVSSYSYSTIDIELMEFKEIGFCT